MMEIYTEYLNRNMNPDELNAERKAQLKRISKLRERGVLVFASDINKGNVANINYSDRTPFFDQLSTIKGDAIDIVLESPGGIVETVEDLVKAVRGKFSEVGVIVPGTAKSAATIFAMAADEILMCPTSALGPIDAQFVSNNKSYSVDAFLEGLNKIKKEAEENKHLDLAYTPILQNISPGEIQDCENAQKFSQTLVREWLSKYKFKNWTVHESTGAQVTEDEKVQRADEIAKKLCNHSYWLTHGRSITMDDLREMKLEITDFSVDEELNDAITRYYTLLHMNFESPTFKVYETPFTQIYRGLNQQQVVPQVIQQVVPQDGQPVEQGPAAPLPGQPPQQGPLPGQPIPPNMMPPNAMPSNIENARVKVNCVHCGNMMELQANLVKNSPLPKGMIKFPRNNMLRCTKCGETISVAHIRKDIENQTHMKVID